MTDKSKPIKLFIAYSSKDEELYKELETHLKKLKSSGHIHSWYERKIIGEKWDQVISEKLETADIILMLISQNFLAMDYCYDLEVEKAVEFHEEGRADLIPIILKTCLWEDTLFAKLKTLPRDAKPIVSKHWKTRKEAFKDVINGLTRVIEKTNLVSEDIFISPGNPVMSHCIKQFSIQDFRCLRNVNLDGIPVDSQWVFLTGENGDGKTALLQALAIGLLEDSEKYAWHLLADSQTDIEIELKQNKRNMIRKFYKKGNKCRGETLGIDSIPLKNMFGYGITRLNIQSKQVLEPEKLKESKPAYSLYNETEGNFRNIGVWLKDKYLENEMVDTDQIRDVKNTLKGLMPNVNDIQIKGSDVIYVEKGFTARYEDLSSGYKSVIAMIGDILVNILTLYPDIKKISDFEGIMLIDELDLHFHPLWQKELPELLSKALPKVQFWAATHSIVPFMGAPERSVFLKVTRMEKEGTKIEKLNIDLKNISPGILLSSPLFDVDILTKQNENPDEFQTHDDWKMLEKFKKVDEILKRFQDEEDEIIKAKFFGDKAKK